MTDRKSAKIVFLDSDTFAPSTVFAKPAVSHEWAEYAATDEPELVERLAGATVAITNKVPIRRDAILNLPDLQMIAVAATGYNVIDLKACREANITVSNVQGYAKDTLPEHVFALILALRRNLIPYRQDVIDGRWRDAGQFCFFDHPIHDLAGSTLGIVGSGTLGRSVGRLGEAFGMDVIYAGRKGDDTPGDGRVPFNEMLRRADVISLHCPLTDETNGLIRDAEFAAMDRKPVLINTARGGVVDEEAAVRAIKEERIAGLGFDVLSEEPPKNGNPLLDIADRPNVIITPHVAWASENAQNEVWRQTVENVEAFLDGSPLRIVT
ncbi:D-2-hydroxyacid dehydrogenase [Notoacmeibacter sp. MSK16QG-6]|uniref:D-2-hydroxyacid dehydrogenase n=1 Tax=Notoacmeibacter sp. MSK16QG-6 TaxID=2957982 RepID=UPI0020A0B2FB|nr:D-2-hydroxyacid dehydrogenase [Notoacmeibacter sp. MSK16QG-6]MCP1198186.1 D-2-hydroxyacid dehydrogenase [Notoacmeibacter sp. MSK16QG-6]